MSGRLAIVKYLVCCCASALFKIALKRNNIPDKLLSWASDRIWYHLLPSVAFFIAAFSSAAFSNAVVTIASSKVFRACSASVKASRS